MFVVLGAVLLDIYRTKKSTEVKIATPSVLYKERVMNEIAKLETEGTPKAKQKIAELKNEMKVTYKEMARKEKLEKNALKKSEKEFNK